MSAGSVFAPIGSLGKQSGHSEKLNSRGLPFGNNFQLKHFEFRELVGKSDDPNQKFWSSRLPKLLSFVKKNVF